MTGRMTRFAFFLALFFLPSLAYLVTIRQNLHLRSEERIEEIRNHIRWNINEATGAYSAPSLMSKAITRFLAAALDGRPPTSYTTEDLKKRIASTHASLLAPVLPPHECFVVRVGTAPERLFTSAPGGGFDAIADAYAQIDYLKEQGENGPIPPLGEKIRSHLFKRFGLLIPIDPLRLRRDDGFCLRSLETTHFLFHTFAEPNLIVIFWMDLGKIPMAHLPALLVNTWDSPDECAMMLPLASGRPLLTNRRLSETPDLLRHLSSSSRYRSSRFDSARAGPFMICAAPPERTPGYRLLVARPLPAPEQWPLSSVSLLGLLLLFATVGSFIAGERLIFGRGPVFTVRRLLPAAFLAVALLPLTGAGVMIGRYQFETERDRRASLQRDLHQELVDIDEGDRAHIASFSNYLRSFHRRSRIDRFSDPTIGLNDIESYFITFLETFNALHNDVFHNILVVASDGRYYSIQAMLLPSGRKQIISRVDPNPIVQYMISRGLHRLGVDTSETAAGKSEATALAEALKQETFQDIFINLGGLSTYINIAFYPHRLFEVKFLHEANFSIDTQLTFAPGLRINLTWVWGCRALDKPYLTATFRTLPDPASPDRTVVMSGMKHDRTITPASFAVERDRFPSLHALLNTGYQTQQIIRRTADNEPGRPVQEVYPARYLRGVIAGQRSTGQIDRDLERISRSALLGLFGFVIGAVLLGSLAAVFFLLPLSELRRGIDAISSGRYGFRLDTSRDDEFGSIAAAFNHMSRRLQEGRHLKSFVSDSVLEAIKTGEADRTPRACDVTVLFSSIVGFEQFKADHGPAEVFAALQTHLSVIDAAVIRHGGEIDKIITDKVMVVFRHDVPGGARAAVSSALQVARAIAPTLGEQGVSWTTAIGMNTGTVVSGTIGAAAFRLDFTVIGDPVNLAARLATLAHTTQGTRIVLSGPVLALAPAGTPTVRLPFREVKGKTQKIEAYLLI
ncbi:MAG TPA: adenylate/guanylate cyclase domain-containing protein [Candidatus Ozemobacteraceae bacterium]|nr:adenylate/guanylate cyclase domain-containing protein [Candidatus Ozemobacteraceae bacterium]